MGLCTNEENGLGGRLAIDLLQELWLEGDHADEAVDSHQVSEDHQWEDAVPEESLQRRNEVWWGTIIYDSINLKGFIEIHDDCWNESKNALNQNNLS